MKYFGVSGTTRLGDQCKEVKNLQATCSGYSSLGRGQGCGTTTDDATVRPFIVATLKEGLTTIAAMSTESSTNSWQAYRDSMSYLTTDPKMAKHPATFGGIGKMKSGNETYDCLTYKDCFDLAPFDQMVVPKRVPTSSFTAVDTASVKSGNPCKDSHGGSKRGKNDMSSTSGSKATSAVADECTPWTAVRNPYTGKLSDVKMRYTNKPSLGNRMNSSGTGLDVNGTNVKLDFTDSDALLRTKTMQWGHLRDSHYLFLQDDEAGDKNDLGSASHRGFHQTDIDDANYNTRYGKYWPEFSVLDYGWGGGRACWVISPFTPIFARSGGNMGPRDYANLEAQVTYFTSNASTGPWPLSGNHSLTDAETAITNQLMSTISANNRRRIDSGTGDTTSASTYTTDNFCSEYVGSDALTTETSSGSSAGSEASALSDSAYAAIQG
jgi:hypothetical protein